VTGVIEQGDVGALNRSPEILHGPVQAGLVQVELRAVADQHESEVPHRRGDEGGVVFRVIEARDILVGGISDDQRNAFLRASGAGGETQAKSGQNDEAKRAHRNSRKSHLSISLLAKASRGKRRRSVRCFT
jgi:hypothetical protein